MKSLTQFITESQQKEYVSLSEKLSPKGEFVDVIIYSEDKEVLVLQRANYMKNFKGMWGVVGGSIEKGETPEEAALREVKEETGICEENEDIDYIKQIGKIKHENGSISYLFRLWTVEVPKVKLSGEHQRYKWISNTDQIKGKWMPDIKEEIDKILK